MKVRDIQTAVIEANYDWTIVKVITDEDIVGYGECFFRSRVNSHNPRT
ncbi:MAG: hypothetical protein ACK40X_12150 [Armatimonadota bacterium]